MLNKSFSRVRKFWYITLILSCSLIAFAASGLAAEKAAPDFILRDVLQGKDFNLTQYRGKVVMLNFFTFFCGPCREEMPDLNKIYQEYQSRGLQVLGIALSSDPTQIRFLVKQLGLDYPVLSGNDKVSNAYGSVAVVPTTVIINKQGNIAHRIEGTRKKSEFIRLIEPLL